MLLLVISMWIVCVRQFTSAAYLVGFRYEIVVSLEWQTPVGLRVKFHIRSILWSIEHQNDMVYLVWGFGYFIDSVR